MKPLILLPLGFLCLVLAFCALRAPTKSEITDCMDASNMSYTQCERELSR